MVRIAFSVICVCFAFGQTASQRAVQQSPELCAAWIADVNHHFKIVFEGEKEITVRRDSISQLDKLMSNDAFTNSDARLDLALTEIRRALKRLVGVIETSSGLKNLDEGDTARTVLDAWFDFQILAKRTGVDVELYAKYPADREGYEVGRIALGASSALRDYRRDIFLLYVNPNTRSFVDEKWFKQKSHHMIVADYLPTEVALDREKNSINVKGFVSTKLPCVVVCSFVASKLKSGETPWIKAGKGGASFSAEEMKSPFFDLGKIERLR